MLTEIMPFSLPATSLTLFLWVNLYASKLCLTNRWVIDVSHVLIRFPDLDWVPNVFFEFQYVSAFRRIDLQLAFLPLKLSLHKVTLDKMWCFEIIDTSRVLCTKSNTIYGFLSVSFHFLSQDHGHVFSLGLLHFPLSPPLLLHSVSFAFLSQVRVFDLAVCRFD
ncbi:hypothetical protein C8R45DRAFT_1102719 [Mycena sanguinolenta]|nr:hypothetical protein C8R45DRAFT_1102719 [Mycena sanguinolenta]